MSIRLHPPAGLRSSILGEVLPPEPGWSVVASSSEPWTRGAEGLDMEAQDFVELSWEDGIITWEIPQGSDYHVPSARADHSDFRGIGSIALKGWQVLRALVPVGRKEALHRLVEEADARLSGLHPHLVRIKEDGSVEEGQVDPNHVPPGDWLILVHGTFCSVKLGFAGFAAAEARSDWAEVYQNYPQRVFGFQHPTLSVSPIQNAIDLIQCLPHGQKVDLISHSRGGMVAELVAGAGAGLEEMADLERLRKERNIQVGRHVRVASPVRGTRLASRRPVDLLNSISTLVNLLQFSGMGGTVLSGISAVVSAARTLVRVITEDVALDPDVAPGLAAMEPGGAVVRALNLCPATVDARLIVGGVFSGVDGLGGKILRFLPDSFFRGDNDLVVDTEYMYTEEDRGKSQHMEPSGPGVHHLSYFTHGSTRRAILGWVINKPETFPLAKRPTLPEQERGALLSILCLTAPPPGSARSDVVFIVPGIMGSMLNVEGHRTWVDLPRLINGDFSRLRYPALVSPEGISHGTYAALYRDLQQRCDVGLFPFDWRAPILDSSRKLAQLVQHQLDRGRRVHLVAHSMGSLVSRGIAAVAPEVHQKFLQQKGQLIMMGPPLLGSWEALASLRGENQLVNMLALFDRKHRESEVLEVMRSFPGLLAMLPHEDTLWWKAESWGVADDHFPEVLAGAQREAEQLDRVEWTEGSSLILGTAPRTRAGWKEDRWMWGSEEGSAGEGDGTVPYTCSNPKGIFRAWYVDSAHGDIPNNGTAIRLIRSLLEGESPEGREEASSVRGSRGRRETPGPQAEALVAWPTQLEMLGAAMGCGSGPSTPLRQVLKVRILHGSLEEAAHPLLVDYSRNAGLLGSLARIAQQPDHPLRLLADAGALPAHAGDLFPFRLNGDSENLTVDLMIFGAGDAFNLTAATLADAVRIAVRRYLLDVARSRGPDAEASLSALMVGTGSSGVLSVSDSIRGLLEGVTRAVDEVSRLQLASVRFRELQIVNAYEDLVAMAADRINSTLSSLETDQLLWEYAGQEKGSRRRGRRLDREDRRVSWSTLSVRFDGGELKYALAGRSTAGRTDAVGVPVSALEADLGQVMQSSRHEPGSPSWLTARLLGRQLVPRDLREEVLSGAPLRLLLDASAAALPWELLAEPETSDNRPLAVRTPIVRSLETPAGRAAAALCAQPRAIVFSDEAGGESGLAPLPGAKAEGREVVKVLRDAGYPDIREVHRREGGELRRDLLLAMGEGPCRILHIAGHGIYRKGATSSTGILIGRKGEEVQVIHADQLLDGFGTELPEMVFINCCHLGHLDSSVDSQPGTGRSRLAASMAEALIRRGVRAVVAAGWAVSDSAATTFAGRLYAELLAGVPFGLAVRAAREAAWVHNRSVNTWGAYQAYGDPSWSLGSGMPRVRPDFRTEAEALDAIDDAIFQARNTKELETALEQIARKMDPSLAQGAGRVDPSPAPPNAKVVAAAAAQTAKVYLALALAWPEGDEKRVSTLLQRAADRDSAAFHQVQRLLTGSARRTGQAGLPLRVQELAEPLLRSVGREGQPLLPPQTSTAHRDALSLRIGTGKVEFLLPKGLPTGGYGPGSLPGKPGEVPMRARAIAVQDQSGARVVLVVADIHSGTQLLHREVLQRVADLGLGPAQVVLAGTHTHTGPARIYGNRLYDGFAGGFLSPTPLEEAWKPVADAIAAAIREAVEELSGKGSFATVAPLQGRTAGLSQNRSVAAFPEELLQEWSVEGAPGEGLAGERESRLVDARLRGWVFRRPDGRVCAVHALVACHNTSLGNMAIWDPDFVGRAMNQVERELGKGVVVNLTLGAAGDQSPLPLEGVRDWTVARKVHAEGKLVGTRCQQLRDAVLAAVRAAPPGSPASVATRLHWWNTRELPDPLPADAPKEMFSLASWRMGAPTMGGAEDYRSLFNGLVKEGPPKQNTLPPDAGADDRLQHPKARMGVGGILGKLVFMLGQYQPAPFHPLHQVDIGDTCLVTLPGEPTVAFAWMLEKALSTPEKRVLVQGYTGDYAGYFTTPPEYDQQHYEGSSTIYGRNTAAHLRQLHQNLRKQAPNQDIHMPPMPSEERALPAGPGLEVGEVELWQQDQDLLLMALVSDAESEVEVAGQKVPTEGLETPYGMLLVGRLPAGERGAELELRVGGVLRKVGVQS